MARTQKENDSSSTSTAIRRFSADVGPEHTDTVRRTLIDHGAKTTSRFNR